MSEIYYSFDNSKYNNPLYICLIKNSNAMKYTIHTLSILLSCNILTAQISFEAQNPAFLDSDAYLNGVSWIDVDNDNDLDVCVTGTKGDFPNFINASAVFVNQGNGVFANTGLINSAQQNPMRHGWADIDNDGDLDVYFGATWNSNGLNELWINNNGASFTLNTTTGATPNVPQPYEGTVSWADYNNDGWTDLFIVRWNNLKNRLFRNNGNGAFSEITAGALVNDLDWSSGAFWGDYDNDRDQDIYVVNYQTGNSAPGVNDLFRNNGDGTFTKITTAGPPVTDAQNSRSANWVDANNDGLLDIYVCNQFGQDYLYLNLGNDNFDAQPVGPPDYTSWSSNWGDYDNDGDQDLVTVGFWGYESRFYQNDGQGNLTDITANFTNVFPLATNGSNSNSIIFADADIDGWLDLHITQPGPNSPDFFFRNQGEACKSWLEIKLTGTTSNKAAIGATARAKATINGNPVWQMRQVSAQSAATGVNPLWLHLGFDEAAVADSLIVEWPSGATCVFVNFPLNRFVEITEGCNVEVIKAGPSITGSSQVFTLCLPASDTLLTPPSGPGGSWSADCGDCLNDTGLFQPEGLAPGQYTLLYNNGGICGSVDTIRITLAPTPQVDAGGTAEVIAGETVQLNATGADNYVWQPGGSLSCTGCADPVFTADSTTTFILTGSNDAGCSATDTVTVTVLPEPRFQVPNIFTPNNDDRNDVFKPVFKGDIFTNYSLVVYNRWGNEVFRSTQPTQGWDGGDAPSDVYVYMLRYELIDGKSGQEKGEVTLLR